jgi:hypothetical protein
MKDRVVEIPTADGRMPTFVTSVTTRRGIHHQPAAERDWELIFAMFHRQIPPHAR